MIELTGKSTTKRRKAAKSLRNMDSLNRDTTSLLLDALKIEQHTSNWMTQIEIFETLAHFNVKEAADCIYNSFIKECEEYDIAGMSAAKCYVRLKRMSNSDVSTVLDLLEMKKYSISEGALSVLGYDEMVPSFEDQEKIISKMKNFGDQRPKGYTDPRYGLAAACYQWNEELVRDFLEDCSTSLDTPLVYVAKNSLKRKKSKLR